DPAALVGLASRPHGAGLPGGLDLSRGTAAGRRPATGGRTMKIRRGASLVELLVVMSACTSILTTSVVLVHRVMHVQSKARSSLAAQRSALRLSEQFRRDVDQTHDALANDLPAEVVLQLQLPEKQTVEYRYLAGVVRRTL